MGAARNVDRSERESFGTRWREIETEKREERRGELREREKRKEERDTREMRFR